jgi:phosphoesterase RecJ-like protein
MKRNSGIPTVVKAIRRHRHFLIASHVNPEGDALGSMLALGSLLKRLGKRVVLANQGGIPETYAFLPHVAAVLSGPSPLALADAAITVDVPLLERTGTIRRMIEKVPLLINIDHHVSNQYFGDINWVDPHAAAVGEMIHRLFRAFRLIPTRAEALCLYVSIVSDTGSFRYMNTTPHIHRLAAELIQRGVSPLKTAQALYECHSAKDIQFLGNVLGGLRQTCGGRVAWLEVPSKLLKRMKPGAEMVDELVNYPRSIRSVEVAFCLREASDRKSVRVSFRSKGRVDVDRIARRLGGGGHPAASGCTVQGTLAEARSMVLRVVRDALCDRS